MTEFAYLYAIKVRTITVNGKCQVFFDTKDKSYAIYMDGNGFWIQDDEKNKCRLVYFMGDEEIMSVITHGECGYLQNQGWILLNKWELEEAGN